MDEFVGRGIGTYLGAGFVDLAIFGMISMIITLNFSGWNRRLLVIALTMSMTLFVRSDRDNNLMITLIVAGILSALSFIVFLTNKEEW